MIPPERALRAVRSNLRREVMPALESSHARAVLAAALGILDELVVRVQLDERPARCSAAQMAAAAIGWESALAERSPEAAASVAAFRREAETAADAGRAREAALAAAETAVAAAWGELEGEQRDSLLARIREPVLADVKRQRGRHD